MVTEPENFKVAYIVKMFPRLSETFILNEILELEKRGVEIVIFSIKKPNEGKFHSQLESLKAKVYYLEDLEPKKWVSWLGSTMPSLSASAPRFWSLMDETLKEGNPTKMNRILHAAWVGGKVSELGVDHVHSHFASIPSTLAYYTHLITKIPFSFTAHAKDIFVYSLEENLLPEKLASAKFAVTVTNYNKRYLTKKIPGIDPEVIKVIYNGLDPERFDINQKQTRQDNLIFSVGRLVPKKGFDTLLNACKILKDSGVSFKCQIVGTGVEEENLLRQRQDLDLTDVVEFLGPLKQNEVMDMMQRATLLCLPCTTAEDNNMDALPTVLLESLACGLPIISTNISGIPEIVDSEVDGILIKPDNPKALSEAIKRLLSSDKLQKSFAEKGRQKAAARFDLGKNIESMLKLYLESKSTKKERTGQTIV